MLGVIRNPQGERLDYALHQGRTGSKGIAVLGHGVTGNKDRPFIRALAEGLVQAGVPALRFSYSGNGDSEGRFEDSTVTKEVQDLGAVLDALSGYRVCYAGHSMGAAVGVLRACEDDRIKLLVSLAGMVHTQAFAQREFGGVTPGHGYMWDEPGCPLSQAYMEDMARIGTVAGRAAQVAIPWLLLHGTEDDVVPIQDSYDILAGANEPKELIKIEGAGHVFSGDATAVMVGNAVGWIRAGFEKSTSQG